MSPTEIALLAVGLVVGVAVGVVVVRFVRARPAAPREIRLTITPNAIPGRLAATLAAPRGAAPHAGAGPGAPVGLDAEAGEADRSPVTPTHPPRTRIPSAAVVLPATAVGLAVGEPGATSAAATTTAAFGATPPASGSSQGVATDQALGAGAAVALLERRADRMAAPGPDAGIPDDGFTTLVLPLEPADVARRTRVSATLPVAVASSGPGATAGAGARVAPAVPAARLAPPCEPTPGLVRAAATPNGTPGDGPAPGKPGAAPAEGAASPGTAQDSGPCAEPRRAVDERCALADVTRAQAQSAVGALREAQREYDILRGRVDRAEAQADPRHVAAEKERLHASFRAASDRAASSDETEEAARAWLNEINTLNAAVRDAQRAAEGGGAELRAKLPLLERLSAESDAARIAAENAEAACHEARVTLAACEEAEARASAGTPVQPDDPHPFAHVWPLDRPELPDPRVAVSDSLDGVSAIVRILRGDRDARERVVAALAAGAPEAEREWQRRVARLVDAIIGRAIEDGYLDLPPDDPFWRLFAQREVRDIVGALSALGFRFDGLGGFADGRVPAARDLSLAVGYAGLDRMRIRTWPRESDIGTLYARATIAADEWLNDQAGDLSLGLMVDALGGRAAELADVWNAWGRVRPALLAP